MGQHDEQHNRRLTIPGGGPTWVASMKPTGIHCSIWTLQPLVVVPPKSIVLLHRPSRK
jgi:hypothetical protein